MSKTTPQQKQEIAAALEVFVKGWSLPRSFNHPCSGERVGPVWVVRDAPRKRAADYRYEEWVAFDIPAEEADACARKGARAGYCICAILPAGEPDQPLRSAYKALGYRLIGTEPLMIHRLRRIPGAEAPVTLARVRTPEAADAVRLAAGGKQILAEHLGHDDVLRLYAGSEDGRVVGWVRSVPVGDKSWVSNMHVIASHRRRGIGKALLGYMLKDDRRLGITQSVLLSSRTGAMLYPHLGYEQIGMLYHYKRAKQ
jgi:GNAT superfamily N-acetyltransferase